MAFPRRKSSCWGAVLLTVLVVVALLATAWGRPVCEARAESASAASTAGNSPKLEYTTIGELKGKKLGMLNGVIFDQLLMNNREGFSQDDMSYYNSNAETVGALQAKKVDAMITDQPIAELAVNILRAAVPGPANLQRAATGCRGTYHAVFGSCRA